MQAASPEPRSNSLSKRMELLRDCYLGGVKRAWSNKFRLFSIETPFDKAFDETSFDLCTDLQAALSPLRKAFTRSARPIRVPEPFFKQSIAERRAWLLHTALVDHMPQEILPGDLIAGGRFHLIASRCLNQRETAKFDKAWLGKSGIQAQAQRFFDRGFGSFCVCGDMLVPDYPSVLKKGFSGVSAEIRVQYDLLSKREQKGPKGAQLRAMRAACQTPVALAEKYAARCAALLQAEQDPIRKAELLQMQRNLQRVPSAPAQDFYEALQSLWIAHMLMLACQNGPAAGVSLGRIDQYLLPYWQTSIASGMERTFGKELLKCFFLHCCSAHDGIPQSVPDPFPDFMQSLTLSGRNADGRDMTNELTYVFLEAFAEMTPIPEPGVSIRLHRDTPDRLLDTILDLTMRTPSVPITLLFDERTIAGLWEEQVHIDTPHAPDPDAAWDYASISGGAIAFCGNDSSATVFCRVNLAKAVELALGNGRDLASYADAPGTRAYVKDPHARKTGEPNSFDSFDAFLAAFYAQLDSLVDAATKRCESVCAARADFLPQPYPSSLVRGCADAALDITQFGAEIHFVSVVGTGFVTAVDSLLAIRYLVFDRQLCSLTDLVDALKANWTGYESLQAAARFRAPKFGHDADDADAVAADVATHWVERIWQSESKRTHTRFRPGIDSWRDASEPGDRFPATPDGRTQGRPLRSAIRCANGVSPTAASNSVGKILGCCDPSGAPVNRFPAGMGLTVSLSSAEIRRPAYRETLKSFLRGYAQNGGTALRFVVSDATTPPIKIGDEPEIAHKTLETPSEETKPPDAIQA